MMRNIIGFFSLAQKAVESSTTDKKITWSLIKEQTSDLIYRLTSMKFENPKDGKEQILGKFTSLKKDIEEKFRNIDTD